VTKSYQAYKEMIHYYAMGKIIDRFVKSTDKMMATKDLIAFKKLKRENWTNLGGQLVSDVSLQGMLGQIRKGSINSWDSLHQKYQELAAKYEDDVLKHAVASLWEINQFPEKNLSKEQWMELLDKHFSINEKVCKGIVNTRKKDLSNPFRKSVYSNEIEQEAVLGKLADNSFIKMKSKEHKALALTLEKISAILQTL